MPYKLRVNQPRTTGLPLFRARRNFGPPTLLGSFVHMLEFYVAGLSSDPPLKVYITYSETRCKPPPPSTTKPKSAKQPDSWEPPTGNPATKPPNTPWLKPREGFPWFPCEARASVKGQGNRRLFSGAGHQKAAEGLAKPRECAQ